MKAIPFPALMAATATQTSNIDTILRLFDYFGKGDAAGIVNLCSDDVDWLHDGNPDIIPFCQHYHGKNGVMQFFMAVGQNIQPVKVVPANFRQSGNEVHHDFHVTANVISTGKTYSVDVTYIWTFNDEGKICKYRCPGDFSGVEAAFQ
jgi:ketosteroid isomerase-like protein